MTRDKAVELRMGAYCGSEDWRRAMASRDVDDWAALGMLKLDAPEGTPEAAFGDVLNGAGLTGMQKRLVIDGLYADGFKVVRK